MGRVGKIVSTVLLAVLLVLQYPLWLGDGGLIALWKLEREISQQQVENTRLKARNAALEAEVQDLKQGYAAIEERARAELGMVRKGETFYQVIEQSAP
jgi:cell division protein FtsB